MFFLSAFFFFEGNICFTNFINVWYFLFRFVLFCFEFYLFIFGCVGSLLLHAGFL